MNAVVLAAGRGQRLGGDGPRLPKPLVPVAGKPLVARTLAALAEAGAGRALVVTGHRQRDVRRGTRAWARLPLSFAANPRFREGASRSLAAARAFCGDDPFLLVMCDHALSPELIAALLRDGDGRDGLCRVAADRSPRAPAYAAEATKLAIDADGFVTAIGKGLAGWDALDAGAFLCAPSVWEAAEAAPEDCALSDVFAVLARERRLRAADVSGCFWYDIDTPDDLREAERLLAGR